jgi:Tol biopolymer transport system component
VSVDRHGRASPLPGLPLDAYRTLRVSPLGERLAIATRDDIWIYDFARATRSRLTTNPAQDTYPLWTPDGQRIIFPSTRAGYPELFTRRADSTGSDERLLARAKDLADLLADGWSRDQKHLLFTEVPPSIKCSIGQIAIERPSDVKLLVKSEFCNAGASVSPDGHWIAYSSSVSDRHEIFVERYPELGTKQQLSTSGGAFPLWSRDGRELFFMTLDGRKMFSVPVQSGATLVAGVPQVLFEFPMLTPLGGNRPYDIAPDGRFLIIRSGQADPDVGPASTLILVQNWFEELKRLVPVK